MRCYVLSDIHGCLDAFAKRVAQLQTLGFFEEGCDDELVLLGDYIDGMTVLSGRIPVLVYDRETDEYMELDDKGELSSIRRR